MLGELYIALMAALLAHFIRCLDVYHFPALIDYIHVVALKAYIR